MRRATLSGALAATLATVLCACSAGGGATPKPSVSSTPPPVQRTVAAGAPVHVAAPSASHTMPGGRTMPGMSMSGTAMPGMSMPATIAPGAVVANGTGPSEVAAPNVDGCVRAYGRSTQCVPVHAPGGGPVTCTFLRSYDYLPLLVTKDPLHLLTRGGVTTHVSRGRRYITGCTT